MFLLGTLSMTAHAGPNQLIVQFDTGNDDLRGGNDNVHLLLLQRSGGSVRLENVNGGRRWADGSCERVTRRLPDTVSPENIVGVRLETTVSGGAGGDNWNLNGLTVSVEKDGATRALFASTGTPLFRFTGDRRVSEFLFSATSSAPAPAPAVMTRFNPNVHGFKFANGFTNIVISEVNFTTRGLCGGMAYGALDYFKARKEIPRQDYQPAEGTPLQSYLYQRQVHSIERNIDKWGEVGINPLGARNRELFNWGLQAGSGRLGELRTRIDRGEPVPIGLWELREKGRPQSHQVLAIGYELGRYRGDLGEHIADFKIFVYDPNEPKLRRTLMADVAGAQFFYKERTDKRWRTYFVDTKYSPAAPPDISLPTNELIVRFETGGDDLRGGNDNVHLSVLLRAGEPIRFENVNDRKRWIDRSAQTVSRPLPASVRPEDIVGVRLDTTFGGGLNGDNWNLDLLKVGVRAADGTSRTLLEKIGAPLFRFTGDQRVREFRP